MNPLKIKYSWLLGVLISLVSCEDRLEDVEPPSFVEKLVVTSFISPADTVLYVSLQKNRPVFGELTYPLSIETADVVLSDGSHSISLVNTGPGEFSIPVRLFPITDGKHYTLSVKTPDGLIASAECDVPFSRNLTVSSEYINSGMYSNYRCKIKVMDFAGEKNYYKVTAYQVLYRRSSGKFGQMSEIVIDKPIFSDAGNDGKELVTLTSQFNYNYGTDVDSAFIKVSILNTDYQFYKYHVSLSSYNEGSDPFSEVTPVYSNINNGLGVFCAYTQNIYKFRLK